MKLSVVLRTINSATHIKNHLDLLLKQSRPADELLIIDDASTDNTVAILEEYKRKVPQANITIVNNNQELGEIACFKAITKLAQGDIIVFSEPKDLVGVDKIKKFHDLFDQEPLMRMAFSNASIIDQDNQVYIQDYFGITGFYEVWDFYKEITDVFLKTNQFVPLQFLVIDRKFLDKIHSFFESYPTFEPKLSFAQLVAILYGLFYPPEFLHEIPYVLNFIQIPIETNARTTFEQLKPIHFSQVNKMQKWEQQQRISSFIFWLEQYLAIVLLVNPNHEIIKSIRQNIEFQERRLNRLEQAWIARCLASMSDFIQQNYRKFTAKAFTEFYADLFS